MNKDHPDNKVIGIIVTHGRLAEELIRTAELIVGNIEDCYAISGSVLSDEGVVKRIREIIDKSGSSRLLLFVDHYGGSCCINCVRAVEDVNGVKVISGVNLPLLLDFASKRNIMEFDEMVKRIIDRGKESIKVVDL